MASTRAWFLGCCVLTTACGASVAPSLDRDTDLDAQVDEGIINGREALQPDFPATGALLIRGTDARHKRFAATCSGTLIAPDVVLTAAHCTEAEPGESLTYYFSMALDVSRAGHVKSKMPKHTYNVTRLQAHPDYNGMPEHSGLGRTEDLAIAYLDHAVSHVEPATMLTPEEARALRVNMPVDIVGYGARSYPIDEEESIEKTTGKSSITEIGPWEMTIGHGISNKARRRGNSEAEKCYGDSGGPTYFTMRQGVRLAGITSHIYSNVMRDGVPTAPFELGTIDERVDAR
jgi:hypothetical protein